MVLPYALVKLGIPDLITILLMFGVIFFGGYFILSWVKRFGGWIATDRLALASGIMVPWLLRMPLLEFGLMAGVRKMNMSGMTIAAVITVVLLWKGFITLKTKEDKI